MTEAQRHLEQMAAVELLEHALQQHMFVQYDGVHLFRFSETPLHREEDDCLAKMAAELAPKLYADLAAAGLLAGPDPISPVAAGSAPRRSHLRCLPGGLAHDPADVREPKSHHD